MRDASLLPHIESMSIPVPGRLAEALRKSTVQIRGGGQGRQQGSGSGVILGGRDEVVTNAHVVRNTPLHVESWEGHTLPASVVHIDPLQDLALLSVPSLRGESVTLGDSELLRVGMPVVAVGNPFGFVGAISSGTIHRIGALRLAGMRPADSSWICSDLRLAPGNSGGPLANFQGHVIGINTMIAAGGLAFAIASRSVQKFLKRVRAPLLGVSVRPVSLPNGRSGLLLVGLTPQGPAETASLLLGDILVAANGRALRQPEDLLDAIDTVTGPLLALSFYRGGQDRLRLVTAHLTRVAGRAA